MRLVPLVDMDPVPSRRVSPSGPSFQFLQLNNSPANPDSELQVLPSEQSLAYNQLLPDG